ncbi:unnamed protein product [Arctogadus glacialis]
MANIFLVFCLMNRKTQQLKQPSTILLIHGFLYNTLFIIFYFDDLCFGMGRIICSCSHNLCNCDLPDAWEHDQGRSQDIIIPVASSVVSSGQSGPHLATPLNMTTYVWLMFYYYIMIVPSQRALFLWVKKNIKSVIYVLMLLDGVIFLCDASFKMTYIIVYSRFYNGTEFVHTENYIALFSIVSINMFLCLFGYDDLLLRHDTLPEQTSWKFGHNDIAFYH